MGYIKNSEQILDHGNLAVRKAALTIIEHALAQADPYRATRRLVRLDGRMLHVGGLRFDLSPTRRIFVVGAGKATFPIAKALEDILGERIVDGVVICKYGQGGELNRSRLLLAAHPIPDESGFQATQKALDLARRTGPGDIVFGCVTGGSSALMPYPVRGVSLADKKRVNELLLTCGANIIEINAVRKHLSRVKGGRLALAIDPGAHLINLTVSDVIGDPLDYITDPTVPDTSTFEDARQTMSRYDLWRRVPPGVARFLKTAGAGQETPKECDLAKRDRNDFILVPGDAACSAAGRKARELGFQVMILSTMFEGESKELGGTFAAVAKEILLNQRPLRAPCAVIGGGETTVRIMGPGAGAGGPNQEFALGAALGIAGIGEVAVAGLDTDGTDGPTDTAGALVDDRTLSRAQTAGIDLHRYLSRHDVTPVLSRMGDAIVTGATGTNVNDLKLMLLMPAADND